jgi:hypothetical protein
MLNDPNTTEQHFAICLCNNDYPASLDVRKIYQILPDTEAAKHHQLRVIDESGEDYLYPDDYFASIQWHPSKVVDGCFVHCVKRISRNGLLWVSGNPLRSIPETTVHYFCVNMKGADSIT